jgi:hypothetical protein
MHTSALRFLMCAVSRSDGDTVIDLRDPWRPPCGPLGFLALGPRANRAGERDLPPAGRHNDPIGVDLGATPTSTPPTSASRSSPAS